jgi:serine/threonine-protein kinase PRP4
VLKICDLGTAIDKTDAATAHMDVTPYLVSRFYRAPEIILGIPYDYAVDMWSIGCTLYEMYTGKILFAGDSNNQMLKAIMEIRGRLTPKLFKRGQLSPAHFDDKGQFVSIERDKVLGKVCCDSIHSLHVVFVFAVVFAITLLAYAYKRHMVMLLVAAHARSMLFLRQWLGAVPSWGSASVSA